MLVGKGSDRQPNLEPVLEVSHDILLLQLLLDCLPSLTTTLVSSPWGRRPSYLRNALVSFENRVIVPVYVLCDGTWT